MHFPTNAWGLHDMHGSAWLDDDSNNINAKNININKDYSFGARLLRGGSWGGSPEDCRSACRDGAHPGIQRSYVGFRVCCLPQD